VVDIAIDFPFPDQIGTNNIDEVFIGSCMTRLGCTWMVGLVSGSSTGNHGFYPVLGLEE